ncbi:MAG: ABC transporter substrate-binding protein [Angelakisella sp.]
MKKRWIALTAALLAVTMILSGCAPAASSNSSQSVSSGVTAPAPESPSAIPEQLPETIVSLSPSNTEVLLALGLASKLVAVDTYSAKLPGVPATLPQFDMMKPDAEALVALKADLILTTGMSVANGEDPFQPVRDAAGSTMVDIATPASLGEIADSLLLIGKAVGKPAEAQALVDSMKQGIDQVAAIGKTISDKKKVYVEISAAPYCYSFGSGVYLNEALELLGATNVLADQTGWVSVSEEAVIAANPQVILTNVDYIEKPVEEILARTGWASIDAVKNKQVFFISTNPSTLPNHNVVLALREMAKAIYPEAYQALS